MMYNILEKGNSFKTYMTWGSDDRQVDRYFPSYRAVKPLIAKCIGW